MDQLVLLSMKFSYKSDYFLQRMLNFVNSGESINDFVKQFNVKDAVWSAAKPWNSVYRDTLKNAWHNLWPATLITEDDNSDADFEGFRSSKKTLLQVQISELLTYSKNASAEITLDIDYADIEEVMCIDNNAPFRRLFYGQ